MSEEEAYAKIIPEEVQDKWQNIVNILVKTTGCTDALITRFDPPLLDIFTASDNIENIYAEGTRTKIADRYCGEVIKSKSKVMVIDALEDDKWQDSLPAQQGMRAYLGYPLTWPDGKIFGTLCLHDKKKHNFSEDTQEIMLQFKDLIEAHLEIIKKNIEISRDNQLIKSKDQKYEKLFSEAPIGIFETTSQGRVISINKSMAEILGFSRIKDALRHYNDLHEDLYLNPQRRDEFIRELKKKGRIKNFEYQALGKDNAQKWINMNAKKGEVREDGSFLIEGYAFDITARKLKEEKIKEQKEELAASFEELTAYNQEVMAMNEELEQSVEEIHRLNQRFVNMIELVSNMENKAFMSEKEFFSDFLKNAINIVPEADYAKMVVKNEDDKYVFIDAVGHNMDLLKTLEIDKEYFYNYRGKDIYSTKDYFINLDEMELSQKEAFLRALEPIKDSLYINITFENQVVGRLALDIKEGSSQEFSSTTRKVLKSFATLASAFFALKRFDNLQTNFTRELITSIIKIMEMYDLYTKGHSENVAEIASAIAKKLGLSKKTIRTTYWAGLVHDIGKLLVPLNIINKTEGLSDREYEVIKKHPRWGSEALSNSEVLKPISEYILYHHEKWDGSGYPAGISGDEIPIISQILSVADAWDAMLSQRAYRDALSVEEAVEEVQKYKGSQFSPRVVTAFLEIVEDNSIDSLKKNVLQNEVNISLEEKKLLKDKGYFEDLFEEVDEGIVILDDDFNIIRANTSFLKMFAYSRQAIIGENIKKIVPGTRVLETEAYINRLSRGQKVSSRTVREKQDGTKIEVSLQAFPVFLQENHAGYYVIYRDRSELADTKRMYENIKGRYQALFENENTAMLIIDPDNGKIVDANPAAVNFYGWSKDELTSMKITDINVTNEAEVRQKMKEARKNNQNYFNFKHKIFSGEIKEVEVYSQPIPFAEKEYLYSIIHEAG